MAPKVVVVENHRSYEITIYGENPLQASGHIGPQRQNMDTSGRSRMKKIEDIPWYHHNLTRNSTEVLLLSYGRQGSYLIRPSKTNPGHYTVSVKSLDSIKHFPLVLQGTKFVFGIGEFNNVEQLMEHFQNYPIIGGETGQPVTLSHPYPSEVEEPSVYDDISRHAVCGSSFNHHRPLSTSNSSEQEPKDINWTVASKEGFLTKQGAIHKNWKRRWFVTNRNTLQYYNERGDKKPIRVLDLRLAEEASKNNTCGKPNAFSLVFPYRTFLLCADTEQEMQEWIDLLKWKLDKIKHKMRSVTV
ncbi:dual adapter for phosphotyrosine and 3-phosphotyrosine and 3-phosphoinositide-like isoform X2 [Orbicella faveolata]|uniref:dual adapter for phosphotyrosine and 3-phosphotyrosine and 3-phosphoinositide-like isoform X2 n=1 Tax=Orbicella faveolata TaxID=48498 RepID=UPI0009E52D7E|nr:dual adapter for phosphotyrosine and 3-phosphotyrosine and 3-phosphoinositide-like isoform X2 [Orbicella faveolata]XP_020632296.1 dual adapter for phosphotyrosine and 3-phosphotyrosine and 3-phosphoinositide-like isoform X2 [Orbicella faveolata]